MPKRVAVKHKLTAIGRVTAFILFMLGLPACQANLVIPPRLATATARAANPTPAPATAVVISAPTPTGDTIDQSDDLSSAGSALSNPSLSVWINESIPENEAALIELANRFTADYQIDVELIQISPFLLPDLVSTAVLSDTLPDVIFHPLEFSIGWAEQGVFNLDAHNQAIEQLDVNTFNPNALSLLDTPMGAAAIPSDGYQQLLIYRQDWIDDLGLPAPTNFNDMFDFAAATFDAEQLLTAGFVIPTESNLTTTHQAFEHLAVANGCQLIDDSGEVQLLEPDCLDAINFYFDIVHNFSPSGVQTVTSTQNAYLEGRTGMIMISPSILPMLANGVPASPPSCPECTENPLFLAQNSQIVTHILGRSANQAANFSTITSLGITASAQPETAVLFTTYWFNEAYPDWLALNSERKVPMRLGTPENPTQFIDTWGTLPLTGTDRTLVDLFGETAVERLKNGVASSNRWGFAAGQGAVVTKIYEELTLSIVLQEMLSGYFDPSQTLFEAYNRVVEQIPNYQFPIVEPTEVPEE